MILKNNIKSTVIVIVGVLILLNGISISAGYDQVKVKDWDHTTIVRSDSDIGQYPSMAIDDNGDLQVCYHNLRHLKYIYQKDGKWNKETIDNSTGHVGLHPHLVLDKDQKPHVSYYDEGNDQVKYAWKEDSGWKNIVVEKDETLSKHTSLAIDKNGTSHIIYRDYGNGALYHATVDGKDVKTEQIGDILGQYSDISIDSEGVIHICYSYQTTDPHKIKYAKFDGKWKKEVVDKKGKVGNYLSLELDENDDPHISYYDKTNGDLKYAVKDMDEWDIKVLDSEGNVGKHTSLEFDKKYRPYIAYQDAENLDLKLIRWTGKRWIKETVCKNHDLGFYSALAIGNVESGHRSNVYIAHYGRRTKTRSFNLLLEHCTIVDPDKPAPPEEIGTDSGSGYINLSWEPPKNTGRLKLEGYGIYRMDSKENMIRLDNVTETYYNDTDVENGEKYYYSITSINEVDESEMSDEVWAVSTINKTRPSKPIELKAVSGEIFINLTWKKPVDNGNAMISSYNIYRKNPSSNYSKIKSTDTLYWNDTSVKEGMNYSYKINAENSIGTSAFSNEVRKSVPVTSEDSNQSDSDDKNHTKPTPDTNSDPPENPFPKYWWIIPIIIMITGAVITYAVWKGFMV